jgi:hypothetical protein
MMAIAAHKPAQGRGNLAIKIGLILGVNAIIGGLITWWIFALQLGGEYRPGGLSEAAAGFVGMLHISFGVVAAAMRLTARFEPNREFAEDLRREGRPLLLGALALIAAGLSLVLLSLAGPDRPVSPASGAAGALALNALAMIVAAVRLRAMDELNRDMAREAGYLAFYWTSLFGGTWALLAHLELVVGPAPLDWLTLMGGFSFAGGLVALARRGGFDTPK